MKMVKSLLLGSAAGLMAVAGAQAADLPVKAKAVEYVKICTLYGVGYYYIPGTDTCIKIGGYVRYEAYHNAPAGAYPTSQASGVFTRHTNTFAQQARFRMTGDVRSQTEYGTLRSYFSFGFNWLNQVNEPNAAIGAGGVGNFGLALERAFIQFAGFTFGRSDTFFAFYNGAAYGFVPLAFDGSSGPAGLNVAAYTWQFGNGVSATIAIEDAFAKGAPVNDLLAGTAGGAAAGAGLGGADDRLGQQIPDIVANLRVDQAWGSAQIMGSLHQVGARYDGAPCNNGVANNTSCTHPDEKWGWAVGAGLTLKMPWDAKDTLSGVIAYAEGHSRAVAFGQGNNFVHKQGIARGEFTDGVFLGASGVPGLTNEIQLTESWGGTIAFEHYWTPSLRTSWVFGYMEVSYNDTAKNLLLATGCPVAGMAAVSNCNPDWAAWRVASRTMWNPVQNLDVGLEVAYSKVDTAYAGAAITGNQGQGLAVQPWTIQDEGFWTATVRVQRSFWP